MDQVEDAREFWDSVYARSDGNSNGHPSALLERLVTKHPPGVALELGCAKGDDAVWLARKGWQVTAVDVSPVVIGHAHRNATRNGVDRQITFLPMDLVEDFPNGRFDLVSAMFLETPLAFPRLAILRRAAEAVLPGGLLLIVSHGSVAPWFWQTADRVFPTARALCDEIGLVQGEWDEMLVGSEQREARGPGGQSATLTDTIIALARRTETSSG